MCHNVIGWVLLTAIMAVFGADSTYSQGFILSNLQGSSLNLSAFDGGITSFSIGLRRTDGTFAQVAVIRPSTQDFSQSDPGTLLFDAQGETSYTVRYRPMSTALVADSVVFVSTMGAIVVYLRGRNLSARTSFAMSDSLLDFGVVDVGSTHQRNLALKNTSAEALTVGLSGVTPPLFATAASQGVEPEGTLDISVQLVAGTSPVVIMDTLRIEGVTDAGARAVATVRIRADVRNPSLPPPVAVDLDDTVVRLAETTAVVIRIRPVQQVPLRLHVTVPTNVLIPVGAPNIRIGPPEGPQRSMIIDMAANQNAIGLEFVAALGEIDRARLTVEEMQADSGQGWQDVAYVSDTAVVTVDGAAGLLQRQQMFALRAYPEREVVLPSDVLVVHCVQPTSWDATRLEPLRRSIDWVLFDALGVAVNRGTAVPPVRVSTEALLPGMYAMALQSPSNTAMVRFLVVRR